MLCLLCSQVESSRLESLCVWVDFPSLNTSPHCLERLAQELASICLEDLQEMHNEEILQVTMKHPVEHKSKSHGEMKRLGYYLPKHSLGVKF